MRTIIAYSTLTGNTETAAEWIRDRLIRAGHSVKLEEAGSVRPDILKDYDLIILGSPTYWDGEVTDDFVPFLDRLVDTDLTHKKAAVFGLGDAIGYPDVFARSVDVIEENLARAGANLVLESLRVDGEPEGSREMIWKWAEKLGEEIKA